MEKLKHSIIGVPLDLGQSRRGVNMGPSAIRYAGVVSALKQSDMLLPMREIFK